MIFYIFVASTSQINHNFNSGIGFLQPAKCLGEDADQIIQERLQSMGKWKTTKSLPNQEIEKNRLKSNKKFAEFQIGMPVLLDLPKTSIVDKETNPKVRHCCFIFLNNFECF